MPEYRNQFLPLAIAFAAGVAVGANWPEIKKQMGPLLDLAGGKLDDIYSQLGEFLAERKERVEDRMAERRYAKKRPAGRAAARPAKAAAASGPAAAADVSSAEAAFLAGLQAVARKAPKKTASRSRKPRAKKPVVVEA